MKRNNRLQVASRDKYSMLVVLWYRIVTVSAPGVAAEYATDSKVQTFDRSVFAECFESILGTGRSEAA